MSGVFVKDPRIVLVHGFNVSKPDRSIELLVPVVEGFGLEVSGFRYGWTGLFAVWLDNDNFADALLSTLYALQDSSEGRELIPVGHSNGCAIIDLVARKAAANTHLPMPFTRAAYLSPALPRKARAARGMEWIGVYHTRSDAACAVARYLPFMPWGDMGNVGYLGDADGIHMNFDGYPVVKKHSDWMLTPEGRDLLADRLFRNLVIRRKL